MARRPPHAVWEQVQEQVSVTSLDLKYPWLLGWLGMQGCLPGVTPTRLLAFVELLPSFEEYKEKHHASIASFVSEQGQKRPQVP